SAASRFRIPLYLYWSIKGFSAILCISAGGLFHSANKHGFSSIAVSFQITFFLYNGLFFFREGIDNIFVLRLKDGAGNVQQRFTRFQVLPGILHDDGLSLREIWYGYRIEIKQVFRVARPGP